MEHKLDNNTLLEYLKKLKDLDKIKHKKISNNCAKAFIDKFSFYDKYPYINYTNLITNSCPHCENTNYIKFGTFKGTQRYRCKGCFKTFSSNTKTSFSYSKKSPLKWNLYLSLMFSGHTIRSCASILDINIATSFSWRHKILTNLLKFNDTSMLSNLIGVSTFTSRENFKGCRNIQNTKRDTVNIIFAIDNRLNSFAAINNIGIFDVKNTYRLLSNRFTSNFKLIPIQNRLLNPISSYFNSESEFNCSATSKYNKELSNNFRFNIKTWIKKFNGIATKYLDRYLVWFAHIYKEYFINKPLFLGLLHDIFNNKYITTNFTDFY